MKNPLAKTTLLLLILLAIPARADVAYFDNGQKLEGTINGLQNGKLSISSAAERRTAFLDLNRVQIINIDVIPKLAEAENARANPLTAKAAADLYKKLIPTINNANLRLLAELRAIAPTDADGRWLDAVTLFLDVYQASPSESVWEARPQHFPAPGSTMLRDSADRVAASFKTAKSEQARQKLKSYLLDIYTQAGDAASAARVANELATGISTEAALPASGPVDAPQNDSLAPIRRAIEARDYRLAVQTADHLLSTARGETAVKLFTLKAAALESNNQPDDAVAALLRVAAHYPGSAAVPAALYHAAQIQRRLNRSAAAQMLEKEIVARYPDSPEAVRVKSP